MFRGLPQAGRTRTAQHASSELRRRRSILARGVGEHDGEPTGKQLLIPKLPRRRLELPGQRLDAVFRDEQRVLELRRSLAVACGRRPLVGPHDGVRWARQGQGACIHGQVRTVYTCQE